MRRGADKALEKVVAVIHRNAEIPHLRGLLVLFSDCKITCLALLSNYPGNYEGAERENLDASSGLIFLSDLWEEENTHLLALMQRCSF